MKTKKMISHLIKPLVLTGMYKNEDVALKDIIITHIKKKIEAYKKTIRFFERKYKKDIDAFTKDIRNKATPELEDDWMEWKGAIEMEKEWSVALREVVESDSLV
jgi:hypothetical protein